MKTLLGSLKKDENANAIQGGHSFVTVGSPLSYTLAESSITVPSNAISLVIEPSTNLRVSDVSGSSYFTVPASTKDTFPVADMQTIYLKGDTVIGTASVRFITI